MRRLMLLVVIIAILIVGGGLTSLLLSSDGGSVLPVLTQTAQPDASPTTLLPWKAEQFFLLIGFIIFNLVGIALTLAVLFWFVDRGIRRNAASANTAQTQVTTTNES